MFSTQLGQLTLPNQVSCGPLWAGRAYANRLPRKNGSPKGPASLPVCHSEGWNPSASSKIWGKLTGVDYQTRTHLVSPVHGKFWSQRHKGSHATDRSSSPKLKRARLLLEGAIVGSMLVVAIRGPRGSRSTNCPCLTGGRLSKKRSGQESCARECITQGRRARSNPFLIIPVKAPNIFCVVRRHQILNTLPTI